MKRSYFVSIKVYHVCPQQLTFQFDTTYMWVKTSLPTPENCSSPGIWSGCWWRSRSTETATPASLLGKILNCCCRQQFYFLVPTQNFFQFTFLMGTGLTSSPSSWDWCSSWKRFPSMVSWTSTSASPLTLVQTTHHSQHWFRLHINFNIGLELKSTDFPSQNI